MKTKKTLILGCVLVISIINVISAIKMTSLLLNYFH